MGQMISALLTGALFAVGLLVSGMTDPANVKGFLDVFGDWRPQLMAVLGAGAGVAFLVYRVAQHRGHPLIGLKFYWPESTQIDMPLVAGAALFGAGWALAGYCPGPALVVAGGLQPDAIIFIVAMLGGNFAYRLFRR